MIEKCKLRYQTIISKLLIAISITSMFILSISFKENISQKTSQLFSVFNKLTMNIPSIKYYQNHHKKLHTIVLFLYRKLKFLIFFFF